MVKNVTKLFRYEARLRGTASMLIVKRLHRFLDDKKELSRCPDLSLPMSQDQLSEGSIVARYVAVARVQAVTWP